MQTADTASALASARTALRAAQPPSSAALLDAQPAALAQLGGWLRAAGGADAESVSASAAAELGELCSVLSGAALAFAGLTEPAAALLARLDEAEYMRAFPAEHEPAPLVEATDAVLRGRGGEGGEGASCGGALWLRSVLAAAGSARRLEAFSSDPAEQLPALERDAKRRADGLMQAEIVAWFCVSRAAVRSAAAALEAAAVAFVALSRARSAPERSARAAARRTLRAAEAAVLAAAASLPFVTYTALRYGPADLVETVTVRATGAQPRGAPDHGGGDGGGTGGIAGELEWSAVEEARSLALHALCSAKVARGRGGRAVSARGRGPGAGSGGSSPSDDDSDGEDRGGSGGAGGPAGEGASAADGLSLGCATRALVSCHWLLVTAAGGQRAGPGTAAAIRPWQTAQRVYALAAIVCAVRDTRLMNQLALSTVRPRAPGGGVSALRHCTLVPADGGAGSHAALAAAASLPSGLGGRAGGRAPHPAGPRLLVLLAQHAQCPHLPARAHGARALAHALRLLSPACVEWDYGLCHYAIAGALALREAPQLRAALPALPALACAAAAAPTAEASCRAHAQLLALLVDELRWLEARAEPRDLWLAAAPALVRALAPDVLGARALEVLDVALDCAAACGGEQLAARTPEQRAAAAAGLTRALELVDALARTAWPRLDAHALRVFERAVSLLARAAPLTPAAQLPALEAVTARLVRALWLSHEVAVGAAVAATRAALAQLCAPPPPRAAAAEGRRPRRVGAQRRCADEAARAFERVCAMALADGAAGSVCGAGAQYDALARA
ncbi:hypothetical protein T492DRAFT_906006 [Pavlovales sp. CCMP2436]|nr:hypothetical protein T492DRAFT_906006 [Pavlovales sp. CCMP2436]